MYQINIGINRSIPGDQGIQYTWKLMDPLYLGISGYWIQYTWNQYIQYTYLGSMHPIYLWIITYNITDINGSDIAVDQWIKYTC